VDSRPEPPRCPDGGELHESALRWWSVWSETPQASVFTDAEWGRLADTARLVDELYRADDARAVLELLREITRREEQEFGWTGPAYREVES
jgi:hypothetical protein